MKWLIASDIHGSAYWCRKLIEAYKKEKADKLILLGDVLYHGPRNDLPDEYAPKEVIEILNGMKNEILCVRGNCDTEVDQMVLKFPVLADYAVLSLGERMIYMTHGHVYNESNIPPISDGDILLHGHTHVPKCTEHESYVYMNPGSVSIPKENSHHGYMTLQDGTFLWKDFDGNVIREYKI
ncbi:MAG TPA: phosphodiesterase [Ruminococcaceae bacterium]|nr:phosphodiesterase [Oscillospiraceae bacterium]HAY72764.1 phosphodiesterase [Oscillospiraceae bacterium]HCT16793.1 phosphodiesterase [Oscillospiraceae bacterium]